jgi:predicted hydrocarbon binding protein
MARDKDRAKPSDREPGSSIADMLTSTDGMLCIGPTRVVVMTESALVFLQRVIHEGMPELIKYGFYEMGYRAGIDLSETSRRSDEAPDAAFRYFIETFRQAGYGDMEVIDFDLVGPEARLRGTDLIESAAARQSGIYRSPRCVCHYARGMFAGLFSQLLGKQVICEELACQYRGEPACEFHILGFAADR